MRGRHGIGKRNMNLRRSFRLSIQCASAMWGAQLSLRKRFEHDRDGYTGAKSEFIKRYTAEAKSLYGKRYSEKRE